MAFETLDCAHKVRLHYRLPSPLTEEWASQHFAGELDVQRFSELVANAKDHLTIRRRHAFTAAGAVGEPRLVVTYGKLLEDVRPVEAIAAFEAILVASFGPIRHHAPRRDVV